MPNFKIPFLSICVSLLPIAVLAAPPSVCNNAPYKDLLPLSAYAPAINFCSMNYPPSAVTVTASLTAQREPLKRATSTAETLVHATTTSTVTTAKASSTSSTQTAQDSQSNKLSSLQVAAHEVISTACSCILPQRTVTIKMVTRTTSDAQREMSTTTPGGVVGPGRTTFSTTTASSKASETTATIATTTGDLDPQGTYCGVRGAAQTTAYTSESSGTYANPSSCSVFCQDRRGPGGRLTLVFGIDGSTCNCYWKIFTDTCKPDSSGKEVFYDIRCPVGVTSTSGTTSTASIPLTTFTTMSTTTTTTISTTKSQTTTSITSTSTPLVTFTITTATVEPSTSTSITMTTTQGSLATCGALAALKPNVYPYYYSNNGVSATPERCKALCSRQKDPNLNSAVTFSLKGSQCACYTLGVPEAFVANSAGPYSVYDMGCAIMPTSTTSTSSTTTAVVTPTATCGVLGQWKTGTTAYWADYPHHNKTPAQCRAACLAARQPNDVLKTYFVDADEKCVCFGLALADIVIPDPDGPETFYDVNCSV